MLSLLHSCDKDNLPAEEPNEMVTAVHVCAPIIVFSYKKNQVLNIQSFSSAVNSDQVLRKKKHRKMLAYYNSFNTRCGFHCNAEEFELIRC